MKDWKPAGYTSVAPYLVVSDATATIKFLVDALDGTQLRTVLRPDGTIMHAEVRIDDTVVMLAARDPGRLSTLRVRYVRPNMPLKAGVRSIH